LMGQIAEAKPYAASATEISNEEFFKQYQY
jgi:hypothetical protein